MSHTHDDEKNRLRKYLNPTIRGKNVDAVLSALSTGSAHLINNVEAVNDQIFIASASGRYLDQRMADRNITRPDRVGLPDDVFREVGIEISNRKQVRDLIMNILKTMYGKEFTRATIDATEYEPYNLEDGDTLTIQYDDTETVEIVFKSSQFSDIGNATAQEIADAITRTIRKAGRTGSATSEDGGVGNYIRLISETDGAASSVKVWGGKAQNAIRFPQLRATGNIETTKWSFVVQPGGLIRLTWVGGDDPFIGKINKNDYVNIYGNFEEGNLGNFTITSVQDGIVGEAYVEFLNPNGANEGVVEDEDGNIIAQPGVEQGEGGILFFFPKRNTIISQLSYGAVYQTENRLLEIFMPATTRIVRRARKGAAHLYESGSAIDGQYSPYIFDPSKPYLIGAEEAYTSETVDANTSRFVSVDDSLQLPDEPGHLVFGFGTSLEEGPVPYIARPSKNTILIDPSYKFKNSHPSGTNISLISQNSIFNIPKDGSCYPFYATDIISGRLFTEELIRTVVATGMTVVIIILYPGDEGLSKWGTTYSEKFDVWGGDIG